MIFKKFCCLIYFILPCTVLHAQRISYSEPDRDDVRSVDFDIIGKINNHFLIYKNEKARYYISVFDNDMKTLDKTELGFLPDKVINSDIITYRDFFYFIYQYQRRNIVYCMAAKMDGNGKIIGEPKQLDTTVISFAASNKIYTIINSEDKQKIAVSKINSKDNDLYFVTSSLFDTGLNLLHKSQAGIPVHGSKDFLTEFVVDDDGGLVFVKASGTAQSDNINALTLITKDPGSDVVNFYDLNVKYIYLDDIRLKVDNANKHYLVTSLFSKTRRGNIDGLYCMLWDKVQAKEIASVNTVFSDDLRSQARSDGSVHSAFNDFYLQNILMRKDGGFLIAAESVYSSSHGNYTNRWDYLNGSPYWSPSNSYLWSSPYSYYYPWWNSGLYNTQTNRYYADNIAVISFDSSANMRWANVIAKSQYDDNTDDFIGYTTLNTGSEIHFLFNELARKVLILTDQSITPDGQVDRKPTLHDLDKDYQFMPKYAKQVGSRQLIVPCQYRNYVCYAKIEF